MKKIFMMFALMMGIVMSANAQEALVDNGTAKDNWYIGAGVGTNIWNDGNSWTLFNSNSQYRDEKANSWWRTQPLHFNVTVGKMFNPYLGAEIDYAMGFNLHGQSKFLDAHNLTANFVVNINNVIGGYHGKRHFFEIELLGGVGWLHNFNYGGLNAMTVRGALRGNFNITKALAITVTPEYVWTPKNVGDAAQSLMGVNVSVGVKWRIPTKRGNFPLRKLYDEQEVNRLNAQIAALTETNTNLSKANADLAETIKKIVDKGETVVVKTQSLGTIAFEKGKAEVDQSKVADVVKALKNTKGTIVLTGTTSPEGSEAFNKDLATVRAESVKKALVGGGIDENRITIKNDYENQRSVIVTVE